MTPELTIALAALVVGGALATAGATLQNVLRNPLAEPYMLGLVGGASLFAAVAIHCGWTALSALVLPGAAFAGAAFSLALVCAIAYVAGRLRARAASDEEMRSSKSTVILAGFVTGSFTGSLQMVLLSRAESATIATLTRWMFGDLHAVTSCGLACGATVLAIVLAALVFLARDLDLLELGYDQAECLGVNVRRTTLLALLLSSIATAVAVALAGAIGFVGLVVPHVARRFGAVRHRALLPLAALLGGVALLLADFAGRLFPGGISAGVVCAVVGAPFFLVLLATTRD